MATILRGLYELKPEMISGSERTMTFSTLKEFSSLEDARSYLVECEVDAVIRKSHSDHISYIENRTGSELIKVMESWPTFIELTERRNLFAHTRGRVTKQYLDNCKKVGIEFEHRIGQRLSIKKSYFNNGCDCLVEVATILTQALWRKLQKDETDKADDHLVSITYNLVETEQYALAIKILEYARTKIKRYATEKSRRIVIINLTQAYKWSGNEHQCAHIINTEDWSACSQDFEMAILVLRDRFAEAASLMRQMGAHGPISRHSYNKWPLFKKWRETESFARAYAEVFGTSEGEADFPKADILLGQRLKEISEAEQSPGDKSRTASID